MYISISNAGVLEHVAGIREELRYMELLQENIRLLYNQADSTTAAPALLQKCAEKTKRLEESFRWRIDFLIQLTEDTQQVNKRIGEIVDEMDRVIENYGS